MTNRQSTPQRRATLTRNRMRRRAKRTPGSATFSAAYLAAHVARLERDVARMGGVA